MAERLIIDNFAGIKHAEIDLKPINIFIGEHATGKSVVAKLVYLFRETVVSYLDQKQTENLDSFPFLGRQILPQFRGILPFQYLGNDDFKLTFFYNQTNKIEIFRKNTESSKIRCQNIEPWSLNELYYYYNELISKFKQNLAANEDFELADVLANIRAKIEAKKRFRERFKDILVFDQQSFIPASRTLFSHTNNIHFSDPFLMACKDEFRKAKDYFSEKPKKYEKTTIDFNDLKEHFIKILRGTLKMISEEEVIAHNDGRDVALPYLSSGQQDALLLLYVLYHQTNMPTLHQFASIYIEEPESHVFPSTHKDYVELIIQLSNTMFKINKILHFTITTHSPYILTSFNNLMQAGQLAKEGKIDKEKLAKIVPKELWLDPENVGAYLFKDGGCESIIDSETGLINAEAIDEVSTQTAIQFEKLLDLEYPNGL